MLKKVADTTCPLLLARLRAGDRRHTETFVREHAGWMLGLARRYLRDDGLAEDCVQESFCNAFRTLHDFEGRCRIKSWLHRIVINTALMKLRVLKRLNEEGLGDDIEHRFDADGARLDAPWSQTATPEEILASREMSALIREKLAELPDAYRLVLLLRDIDDLSTAEVAEALSMTEGAVKVRLHRARAALKRLLDPLMIADGVLCRQR